MVGVLMMIYHGTIRKNHLKQSQVTAGLIEPQKNKKYLLLSIESWLFNRDPFNVL